MLKYQINSGPNRLHFTQPKTVDPGEQIFMAGKCIEKNKVGLKRLQITQNTKKTWKKKWNGLFTIPITHGNPRRKNTSELLAFRTRLQTWRSWDHKNRDWVLQQVWRQDFFCSNNGDFTEDWKYTSFVDFVGYSQNIQRHNAMCRDELVADVVENIGLKLQFWVDFQSIYFASIV